MKKFIILTPIYNDWESLEKLLQEINFEISKWNAKVSIFVINDASDQKRPPLDQSYESIESIKIINMKINRGHARCYAAGLKFIIEKEN